MTDTRFLIGLTGNIATGKSEVARSLAALGAHVIDADRVAHEVMAPGGAAYDAVVEAFGRGILAPDGTIDRGRLGDVVFRDPDALRRLEALTHPATILEVGQRIAAATESVVVVEAIKLVESGMHTAYDELWVVTAPRALQIERLMAHRGLDEADASLRVDAQPAQEKKVAVADRVFVNDGSLDDLRQQVLAAWGEIRHALNRGNVGRTGSPPGVVPRLDDRIRSTVHTDAPGREGTMTASKRRDTSEPVERIVAHLQAGEQEPDTGVDVRRAGRPDLAPIAGLVREASDARLEMDESDVMEWLFSKGLWVAEMDGELVGVAAWQAENLLCVTDVFFVHPPGALAAAGGSLLSTIESEANTLMCEANVVAMPAWTGDAVRACLAEQGYEPKTYDELHRIWREVLKDFVAGGQELLVKRLRERMVMVPI